MPSSLADYLAKNYLTADPQPERPKKKRKKNKHGDNFDDTGSGGLIIADDDTGSGGLIIADDDPPSLRASGGPNHNEDDENSPFVLDASRSTAEFRRKKKSGWKAVTTATPAGGEGEDEADAILASAAAESAARLRAENMDDAPAIEGGIDEEEDGGPRMESGARAGLQTTAQTAAMVAAQERKKKKDLAAFQASVAQQEEDGAAASHQQTIYRDASGRIINVAMKRAEARRAEEEEKEKEERAKEALMGDVQRQQREERRQELRDARAMPLARTAEDEDLNEELRARERWNDPAAQFLTSKKAGTSSTGRPLYKGGFAPNRYGIRPGHRWDGVDRANGFEKEWFQARARKGRTSNLEYAWQMDE